jgi:hypothetical protein
MGTTLFSCADKTETNKKIDAVKWLKTLQSIPNNSWNDVAKKNNTQNVQPPGPATKVNHVKFKILNN